jgi:hypothetical protein
VEEKEGILLLLLSAGLKRLCVCGILMLDFRYGLACPAPLMVWFDRAAKLWMVHHAVWLTLFPIVTWKSTL